MRALVIFILITFAAACTPEITSGAYLCGPDGACPEGFACNAKDSTCVLPAQVEPFACKPSFESEPDNTAAEALAIALQCVTTQVRIDSCMPEGDSADWLTFVAPTCDAGVEIRARLSFSISFAELGLELWNLDSNTRVATGGECAQGGSLGDLRTCIDLELDGDTTYGIKVHMTGEGTCDGACSFNRYTLTVATATPNRARPTTAR